MKLGAVHAGDTVNALYRVVMPMMAMEQLGHQVVTVKQRFRQPLATDALVGCDLVQIHRPVLVDDGGAAVERIQAAGALVSFDEDDNIAAAPDELAQRTGQDFLPRARRNFEQLLDHAPRVALFTTPSRDLADRFTAAGGANVRVIDNYLPGQFNRVRPRGHDGIVVGWHACDEHQLDAEALGIGQVLADLLDAHRDVHVVTVGIDLRIDHERCRRVANVPFDELTAVLADFDVGIVPLADTPMNHGRSNVKAREYAAAGVPWLASPVGAYERLGSEEGGRLVDDDGWFDALDELVRARRDRAKSAKRARAWAQRETVWEMARVWERTFLDTIERARANVR